MNKKILKAPDLEDFLKEELVDKQSRRMFTEFTEQLKIAEKVSHLRRIKKMSQATLAKKVGTTQSNIARLESGNENFTIQTLSRVARALDVELKVTLK